MSYTRVLPRDLFNEAKLLKCYGQLSLLIHDEVGVKWPLVLEYDGKPFEVEQRPFDGGLTISNLPLRCDGIRIELYVPLNSRETYPLMFDDGRDDGPVFTEHGQLTREFKDMLEQLLRDTKWH